MRMKSTKKSLNSTRTFGLSKTTYDISSEETDFFPQSFIFEEMLPFTCRKYNCLEDIYVKKENLQTEFVRSKKQETPTKYKRIGVIAPPSAVDVFSDQEPQADFTPYMQEMMGAITLTALYNNANSLAEILICKLRMIPRILMQCIVLLAPNYQSLYKITLRDCHVDSFTLHSLNKLIALMTLTDICLDDSRLPNGGADVLLKNSSNLKHLSLARCRLGDDRCEEIVSHLHYMSSAEKHLVILNLSSNRITDRGAMCLGKMLRTNRHLRYLNISGNFITDEGADHIFKMFLEFPLTFDELTEKRIRLISNFRKRRELMDQFISEYGNDIMSSYPSNTTVVKSGRKKLQPATKNAKYQAPSERNSIVTQAETFADIMIGHMSEPFSRNNLVSRNGTICCIGNFALTYLNISYNNLSFFSLKQVANIMNYQNTIRTELITKADPLSKRTDLQGVIKIIIEGNLLPNVAQEYTVISLFINKILVRHTAKDVSSRRKSRARVSSVFS